jgi:hypothetical protein
VYVADRQFDGSPAFQGRAGPDRELKLASRFVLLPGQGGSNEMVAKSCKPLQANVRADSFHCGGCVGVAKQRNAWSVERGRCRQIVTRHPVATPYFFNSTGAWPILSARMKSFSDNQPMAFVPIVVVG